MWRLSTGLRNALLEKAAVVPRAVAATTISFSVGTGAGGADQILDSGNGLGGFLAHDYLTILGSANNNLTVEIASVAAGAIDVPAGTLTNEAAGASVILAAAEGGSYRGIFRNGVIDIYSGTQPTTADDAETGTLLCTITLASGAFTPGSPTNGISFGEVADATLHKESGEVWSGVNVATGTAGWFRIYDNAKTTGASVTGIRLDGACATSGAQLNMSNTSLVSGVTTTIDQVNITMPAQ